MNEKFRGINSMLFVCAFIVLVASLEALMFAKSIEIFKSSGDNSLSNNFYAFISMSLVYYLHKIFIPIIVSLYSYISVGRIKPNFLYRAVFGLMVAYALVINFVNIAEMNLFSGMYVFLLFIFFILVLRFNGERGW